jgi:uncharacterized membrane protein YhaH (DUF805 family)
MQNPTDLSSANAPTSKSDLRHLSVKSLAKGLLLTMLPTLMFLVSLMQVDVRRNKTFCIAAILWFIYLIPYILVSHYQRYQIPLIGILTIIYYVFCSSVVTQLYMRMYQNRASAPSQI